MRRGQDRFDGEAAGCCGLAVQEGAELADPIVLIRGAGKTTVEFLSTAISTRVWTYSVG